MKCLFALLFLVACQPVACPKDLFTCPDGSLAARNPDTCEFYPCPEYPSVIVSLDSFQLDAYDVDSLVVEKKLFFANISYSGGCEEHDFFLVWNGTFVHQSAWLSLYHDANGDRCEALIREQKIYDLSLMYNIALEEFGPSYVDLHILTPSGNHNITWRVE